MRIAFLGLGNMGVPMARNLHAAGFALTAWNRDRARAEPLRADGVAIASDIATAVRNAEIAVTMLADDDAERSVNLGTDGLIAHLPRGAIHLCMSTIGYATSQELAAAHATAGQQHVAAPVFGRPAAAAARQLWVVAAGPAQALKRCKPVLEALSRGITFAGDDAPCAHALKLGANALGAVVLEGLAESLALGEKAGLARTDYLALLDAAMFQPNFAGHYGRMMVTTQSAGNAGFPIRLAVKDVSLALAAARDLSAPLSLAAQVRERLVRAVAGGQGEEDLPRLSDLAFIDAGLPPRGN